jgi:hypothetical protein
VPLADQLAPGFMQMLAAWLKWVTPLIRRGS